ncbi:uncharacterized protein K452DRAFT_24156 [Aplosporella prunicola CBS 121167]|uniref:Uncharacterized protein n=1 Tax=Aplosporella prunicola CBS 121167 TaxID=1176127 RepID=A0A6A6BCP2_9PEZI|nr:uncharacterized protein K452DRAFT_24156 [Aplosporella prunicola CBS 121167]KAF2141972.1 hypothetical protein K452DRAFT_24156 [Aplosporella prunicola CBS 121167]
MNRLRQGLWFHSHQFSFIFCSSYFCFPDAEPLPRAPVLSMGLGAFVDDYAAVARCSDGSWGGGGGELHSYRKERRGNGIPCIFQFVDVVAAAGFVSHSLFPRFRCWLCKGLFLVFLFVRLRYFSSPSRACMARGLRVVADGMGGIGGMGRRRPLPRSLSHAMGFAVLVSFGSVPLFS